MVDVVVNDLRIHVETDGDGTPLLLLHGFTGGASMWRPSVPAWPGYRTIAVDLIGHGATEAPPGESRYTMDRCTADLVALLDRLEVERAAVAGYSMGGRVALRLALAAPRRVAALVLESASPGIEDPGERGARIASDRALADQIERSGIAAFVGQWERLPMWATQERLSADLRLALHEQRLRNNPTGLANSLRGLGAGAQAPVHERLPELRMPVLLIAGADDRKYRLLACQMQRRITGARARIVEGAGHAVHLERPEAFGQLVKEFLSSCQ
jgi:2-succinyl-6-hydroxy-2,4-cyclohexadiene-1-carboxylate synthase